MGIAHSGTDLIPLLHATPAECLLLDLMMPGRHGLALLPMILRIQPALKIVVLTMLVDRVVAEACRRGTPRRDLTSPSRRRRSHRRRIAT